MDINKARNIMTKNEIHHNNFPGKIVVKDCVEYIFNGDDKGLTFLDGLNDHPKKEMIISIFTELSINDRGLTYYLVSSVGSVLNYNTITKDYNFGPIDEDNINVTSFPDAVIKHMDMLSIDTSSFIRVPTYHGWEKYIVDGMFDMDVINKYFRKK